MERSIQSRIEAGEYPVNRGFGHTEVEMRDRRVARIYTTRHVADWPIAGAVPDNTWTHAWRLVCWKADGLIADSPSGEDLMPPRTIKDMIEKDEHGRELVPVAGKMPWTATIVATDGPGEFPIIGFGKASVRCWAADGTPQGDRTNDERLRPPGVQA